MDTQGAFLTAQWRKLLMANYIVDRSHLEAYLPPHCELDLWQGNAYISLVGFMFEEVRLKSIPALFHRRFEEVNLRFYVSHKTASSEKRRGVVFIREIVPKWAVSSLARWLYEEQYVCRPMAHKWDLSNSEIQVEYQWTESDIQRMKVWASLDLQALPKGSEAEFILEHYWGYTRRQNGTAEYEVRHEPWQHYPVKNYEIAVDFEASYGAAFSFLNGQKPHSVYLAEGSEIAVMHGHWIV